MNETHNSNQSGPNVAGWGLLAAALGIIAYFYGFVPKFAVGNRRSSLHWLYDSWNNENGNWEHGWIVVVLLLVFIWRAIPAIRKEPLTSGYNGWWWFALGLLLWIGAFRGIQARAAVFSLPFILLGGAHVVLGWRKAVHLVFPLSLFLFMIPVPNLEQRTTQLAILACKLAHHAGELIGIHTLQFGTQIKDPSGMWGDWQIDDGCSGIRSLVALLLIAYVYGMVVHKSWKERAIVFLAAIPVAILANALRITSILIVAKFHKEFAKETWHHASGFFSFAAAFAILMVLSVAIKQGLRAFRPKVKVTQV